MENENREELEQELPVSQEIPEQPEPYTPRPLWQRILAGICLALFICLIIMYYVNIMRGGR